MVCGQDFTFLVIDIPQKETPGTSQDYQYLAHGAHYYVWKLR